MNKCLAMNVALPSWAATGRVALSCALMGCVAQVPDASESKSAGVSCDIPTLHVTVFDVGGNNQTRRGDPLDRDGSAGDYKAGEVLVNGQEVNMGWSGGWHEPFWPSDSEAELTVEIWDEDSGEDAFISAIDFDDHVGTLRTTLDLSAAAVEEQELQLTKADDNGAEDHLRASVRYSRHCFDFRWVEQLQEAYAAETEPAAAEPQTLRCVGAVEVADLSSSRESPKLAPVPFTGDGWFQPVSLSTDSRGRRVLGLRCNGNGFSPMWLDVTDTYGRFSRPRLNRGDDTLLVSPR